MKRAILIIACALLLIPATVWAPPPGGSVGSVQRWVMDSNGYLRPIYSGWGVGLAGTGTGTYQAYIGSDGSFTLKGPIDADGTVDFATSVVIHGQLNLAGEFELDGALDADDTANFAKTLTAEGAIDANSTADFATTAVFHAPNIPDVCSTDGYHLVWGTGGVVTCEVDATGGEGSTGNAFITITADSGDNSVADTASDTLAIVGGDGIDTSSANTEIITITAETATLTNPGISEFATTTETIAGTDTGRAVTPDGLTDAMAGHSQPLEATLTDIADGTIAEDLVNTDHPWSVNEGGTGAATFTDGGLLVGNTAGAIVALGVATNGQIPIGDGAADPVLATITATANETDVTNAAGSITIGIVASPTLDGTNFTGVAGLGTATSITDGLIVEADLNGDEAPADNDILTFDTTGDNFSWQTPAELGLAATTAEADSFAATGTTVDLVLAADGSNGLKWISQAGGGDMSKSTYDVNEDNIIDSAIATAITDGLIIEADLNGDEDPADNDILTFDTTGANFSWQTPTELSLQPLEATLTDIADGTIAEDLVNTDHPWVVNEGGSGAATFTDGGLLIGNAAGAFVALGVATNGQIPIGDGATDPVLATITAVANETDVTNAAGSITIGIVASPTLDGTNFTGITSTALSSAVMLDAEWTAASLTAAGKIELATAEEVNASVDTTRAVTPDALEDWTGSGQITAVGTLATGDADAIVSNADSVTVGKIEVATIAETNTGTSLILAVSPDALGSWEGNTAITSVGTIRTGTWEGTTVALGQGGTGANTAATARAALEAGPPIESVTIAGSALTIATYPIGKQGVAITITSIACITDTGTVLIQLEEGTATAFDGGTDVMDSPITCDSNEATAVTISNGTIAANAWMAARVGTEASSPTMVGITYTYTVN